MYLLLILIPFFNFITISFFGRFLGKKGTIFITLFLFFFAWIISFVLFFEICLAHSTCHFKLWEWVVIQDLSLQFGFLFDSITIIMCFVVFTISTLVHCYSCGYMYEDPHFIRFILFLSLFTFFMLLVVTADNFVQLFFGWECVGLASYLLINFWYTRIQANKSALKAIIVNKIGDLTVIIAIIILYYYTKSFDYIFIFNYLDFIYYNNKFFEWNWLLIANILLLIGVIAKSAQIGLHTWLVDAMEGPTPVSALLHAATMVTVGVFCLIRCNSIFTKTPIILFYITIIGALTALFGSIVGVLQNDIKRIIAYSTCSQLGYMVLACGLNHYESALYHLVNHAFFKALLFLTAGALIHALNGKQDIREMGSLLKIQPLLYISFLIGSLALMGLPYLSGYYSKDFILEYAFANQTQTYILYGYFLGIIGAFFTAFYSARLLFLSFITEIKNINKIAFINLHNLPLYIYIPLIILSIFSIFSGWILRDLFIGIGSDLFEGPLTLFHNFNFFLILSNIENIATIIKIFPNILTIVAISLSYFFCIKHKNYIKINYNIFINLNNFFQKKLFFDHIYYNIFIKSSFYLSYNIFYKLVDRGLFEILGPFGLTYKIYNLSKIITNIHKNSFYFLIMYFLQNIVLIIIILGLFFNNKIFFDELIILIFLNSYFLIKNNSNFLKRAGFEPTMLLNNRFTVYHFNHSVISSIKK